VETSTGIVGLGDAALAADLIPPIVETRLAPLVRGRPVAAIQETWQLMYRGTMAWGRKGLGMVAGRGSAWSPSAPSTWRCGTPAHGEHEFTLAGFAEIARRGAARVLQFDTAEAGSRRL
jgi:L-alanine-DL-glutamate epimerase-like enolase superfamily enzyme